MLVFFLLLVIAAMALGVVGIVVKGLFYLLFTGVGVLLIAFILGALWMRRRGRAKASRPVVPLDRLDAGAGPMATTRAASPSRHL